MGKFKAVFLTMAIALAGCSAPTAITEEGKASLVEQIEQLERAPQRSFEELPGDTNTEKLLYLLDLPMMTKSVALIALDGQIETLERTGNKEVATQLKNTRKLMLQAMDETMDGFVDSAAAVYDDFLTPDEISHLIKVYQDPAMQKMMKNQLAMQAKMVPVGEVWGNEVSKRYQELLAEQK